MNIQQLEKIYFDTIDSHRVLVHRVENDLHLWGEFWKLFQLCQEALSHGRKLLFFGNGGSAADAQHLAAEFVVRFEKNRRALAAMALTTDTSVLTAAANDHGYDGVFARQVLALCQPGDVAIGLSTSGRSSNVIQALCAARFTRGAHTAAFTGQRCRSRLDEATEAVLYVPSTNTARIQEMHILLGHILCSALEEDLCGTH